MSQAFGSNPATQLHMAIIHDSPWEKWYVAIVKHRIDFADNHDNCLVLIRILSGITLINVLNGLFVITCQQRWLVLIGSALRFTTISKQHTQHITFMQMNCIHAVKCWSYFPYLLWSVLEKKVMYYTKQASSKQYSTLLNYSQQKVICYTTNYVIFVFQPIAS